MPINREGFKRIAAVEMIRNRDMEKYVTYYDAANEEEETKMEERYRVEVSCSAAGEEDPVYSIYQVLKKSLDEVISIVERDILELEIEDLSEINIKIRRY